MAVNGVEYDHESLEMQLEGVGLVVSLTEVNYDAERDVEVVNDKNGVPRGVVRAGPARQLVRGRRAARERLSAPMYAAAMIAARTVAAIDSPCGSAPEKSLSRTAATPASAQATVAIVAALDSMPLLRWNCSSS